MRHLAFLTVLYALVAVIALPGPLSASQDVVPHRGLQAAAAQAEPDASSPDAAGFESPEAGGPGLPGGAEAEAPAGGGNEPSAGVEPAPRAGVEPAPGAAAKTAAATDAPAAAQQPAGAQQPAPAGAESPAAEQQTASTSEAVESRAKRSGGDKREPVRPVASAAASTSVTIRDFAFSPNSVTIDVGDTVTWTNKDSVKHSATAEDGSFDTGLLGNGRSGSNTFDEAGTFQYFCKPHPSMKGTITVRAAGSGASGGGGDTGDGDDSSSSSGSSSTGRSSSSGSGSGSGSDSESSSTGSGSSSSGSGSGSTSSGSGSTSSLPNTGAEPATLAIIGLLMLALGGAVQRRAHDGKSPPTGRIGS